MFRLHYKVTAIILVTASLLVTSKQYIGDPIDCIVDGVPQKMMDTFCWIHSTFSIPSRWNGTQGHDVPHLGVAPLADLQKGEEVKYHKYYQWVCFVLYLQAAIFYFPRYIWKSMEGGKIKMLVQQLQEPLLGKEDKQSQIGTLVKYWRIHRGTHTIYAFKFFFCEFLNFANVIGQIYFTDFFLGNEFRNFGLDVISYSQMEHEDRPDPMAKIFPKVTKCTFHKYGPSGTVENKDGLCVLPINIINEKIYIFLWFWFIGLAAVTGLFLMYRCVVILGPQIRVALIAFRCGHSTKRGQVEAILEPDSLNALEKLGDWLVLYFVIVNLDTLTVNALIKQMSQDEEETKSDSARTLKSNCKAAMSQV